MNGKQKFTVTIGAIFILGIFLYPPYYSHFKYKGIETHKYMGHYPLFKPPLKVVAFNELISDQSEKYKEILRKYDISCNPKIDITRLSIETISIVMILIVSYKLFQDKTT